MFMEIFTSDEAQFTVSHMVDCLGLVHWE